MAAQEIRNAAALGIAGILRFAKRTPVPAVQLGRHLAHLGKLAGGATVAVVPLAMAAPLVPGESVPATSVFRRFLKALVLFRIVFPFDLRGEETEAEVGR